MNVIVEGASDEQTARRVVEASGHEVTLLRSVGGKTNLDPQLPKYSRAARTDPWVVFRDSDDMCPVALRHRLLTAVEEANPLFELRIAHTMTEAWLMADKQGFAAYFQVSPDIVPPFPEDEHHAKRTLLHLCERSRSRDIREEVVFDGGVGPLFVEHLNDFARLHWDVSAAAENSPSLHRAIEALAAMPRGATA